MSTQSLAAEQLLELLLQLKKTTPTAARQILNGQPQIAYALITLMASMNAVNVDVCQKILADYAASTGSTQPTMNPPPAPVPPTTSSAPLSAIPPHVQQASYRTPTPPTSHTPPIPAPPPSYPYSNGPGQPSSYTQPPPSVPPSYGGQPQPYAAGYSQNPYNGGAGAAAAGGYPSSGYGSAGYGGAPPPPPPPPQAAPAGLPDTLAGIPDDQKALIMRVISMTPEQLNVLPPQERSMYIQIRSTLGIS